MSSHSSSSSQHHHYHLIFHHHHYHHHVHINTTQFLLILIIHLLESTILLWMIVGITSGFIGIVYKWAKYTHSTLRLYKLFSFKILILSFLVKTMVYVFQLYWNSLNFYLKSQLGIAKWKTRLWFWRSKPRDVYSIYLDILSFMKFPNE